MKVLPLNSEQLGAVEASLVDSLIVYGEEMFVALVRLEGNVERISKRSLIELTADILRGS